jgi:NADH:ubiquinone oxidoreductase subunit 4 (subunit M)
LAPIPWLSFLVFFPLAAAAVLAVLPRGAERSARFWCTVAAAIEFVVSLPLWSKLVPGAPGSSSRRRCRGSRRSAPTTTWAWTV